MSMAALSRTQSQVTAAMNAVEEARATPSEKADMLMQIAMGLQIKPKSVEDLEAAVHLYRAGLDICPAEEPALAARIRARMGTALMATPSQDAEPLLAARAAFEAALPVLHREGGAEEVAEAEMNLGLTLQSLAPLHKASIQDAIGAYQRALRTFDKHRHPKEFAILQNNLASAFMSIPFTDEKSKMREALAVGAFEEGLSVVNLIDHPAEYAMLQNNLGNALQYVSSSHPVENGYRALEAYDEALKVRTASDTPGEYANTISNKANCLANLPDDPADPARGNQDNLRAAVELYREARQIYLAHGLAEPATIVAAAIQDIEADLLPAALRVAGH
jgi:tetratricopeptide (TPR) repeat protein